MRTPHPKLVQSIIWQAATKYVLLVSAPVCAALGGLDIYLAVAISLWCWLLLPEQPRRYKLLDDGTMVWPNVESQPAAHAQERGES